MKGARPCLRRIYNFLLRVNTGRFMTQNLIKLDISIIYVSVKIKCQYKGLTYFCLRNCFNTKGGGVVSFVCFFFCQKRRCEYFLCSSLGAR